MDDDVDVSFFVLVSLCIYCGTWKWDRPLTLSTMMADRTNSFSSILNLLGARSSTINGVAQAKPETTTSTMKGNEQKM